jgi:hypothetical protein
MLPATMIAVAAAIPIFRNTARISVSCFLASGRTIAGTCVALALLVSNCAPQLPFGEARIAVCASKADIQPIPSMMIPVPSQRSQGLSDRSPVSLVTGCYDFALA